MNRKKEVLLKLLIASSIYTAVLGLHAFVHKDIFSDEKSKINKKAKVVKVVKFVKEDNTSRFMRKVKAYEIKKKADKKIRIEKQKQIELKKEIIEKKKAKAKADKIEKENLQNEQIKEEKQLEQENIKHEQLIIANKNYKKESYKKNEVSHKSYKETMEVNKSVTLSRGGDTSSESGNYDTTFNITYYTDIAGSVTSSGQHVHGNGCASNTIAEGTHIKLEGLGSYTVNDTGGSDLNSNNRLDIFLVRLQGESDNAYTQRAINLGRQEVRGTIE